MYNIRNDKYVYYGKYDISEKNVIKNTLIKLTDIKVEIFKLIILNYGLDLFLIGKTQNDIFYFYLENFRNNKNVIKYVFSSGENFNNLEIINNEKFISIK